MNLEDDILIVSDLNMNWLDHKGEKQRKFCSQNTFANFVFFPTRTVLTKTYFSSTLIYFILHNTDSIKKTSVINFLFSDHDIVTCKCTFQTSK